jgi:serine/threonine protein kinase
VVYISQQCEVLSIQSVSPIPSVLHSDCGLHAHLRMTDGLMARMPEIVCSIAHEQTNAIQRFSRRNAMQEMSLSRCSSKALTKYIHACKVRSGLRHPNVLHQTEAFVQDGKVCVIVEWAPCGRLDAVLQACRQHGCRLHEDDIWKIFTQVAVGLQVWVNTCYRGLLCTCLMSCLLR